MEAPVSPLCEEPRLAATILLVRDDPFEVLMVKRSDAGSFPSKYVFPGGKVEAEDWSQDWLTRCTGSEGLEREDIALRIAALRECWEEAGILCVAGAKPVGQHLPGVRPMGELMDRLNASFELEGLARFAHWTTPTSSPQRWNTKFFIARAPGNHQIRCDGSEIVSAEWIEPAVALELAERGERDLLFSTRMNLHLLAGSANVDEALAAARARPPFEVIPWVEVVGEKVRARISPDSAFPVCEDWLEWT